jgi:type III secretory pathway component EscT
VTVLIEVLVGVLVGCVVAIPLISDSEEYGSGLES